VAPKRECCLVRICGRRVQRLARIRVTVSCPADQSSCSRAAAHVPRSRRAVQHDVRAASYSADSSEWSASGSAATFSPRRGTGAATSSSAGRAAGRTSPRAGCPGSRSPGARRPGRRPMPPTTRSLLLGRPRQGATGDARSHGAPRPDCQILASGRASTAIWSRRDRGESIALAHRPAIAHHARRG
jgi:hypothetical protein